MDIKNLKIGDFLKHKRGNIQHKIIEVGNDWRSGYDYVKIHCDVTDITETLINVSNYEKV